jgi:hypothetical protein
MEIGMFKVLYNDRYFWNIGALGMCAFLYDAGNWLHECLASNRPRQAGDALQELLRCDWAPRARAVAVAWAETAII